MSVVDRTWSNIDRGRSNSVSIIPTKHKKLDYYIDGIVQGTYYLLGAETSVGKTAFARETFIQTPYEYFLSINDPNVLDLLIVDASLEISPERNLAAAISRQAFMDYQKVILPKTILNGLSDEHKVIVDHYKEYFKNFEKKLLVTDEDMTPTKYHDLLMEVAKRTGKFSHEGRFISECGIYTSNNPNLFVIVLLDTLNLGELDSDHTTIKSTIDRISRIGVYFRNKCNFIIVNTQQFNAEISAVDRARYGIKTPLIRDFEDSKRPAKDADIVLGLYEPMRHMKEEETLFRGYDISILRSWFRSAHLLKNRRGENNKMIPFKFDGAVGIFKQLPDPKDMTQEEYRKATTHFL